MILNVAFSLVEWDSVFLYSNIQFANCWLFKVQRLNSTYSILNSTKGVLNAQGAWRSPNTTPTTVIERDPPPPPNSGTQYHIVVPYLLRNRLNNKHIIYRQWSKIKNKALRTTSKINFSNGQPTAFRQYQYSSICSVWSLHFTMHAL
jgi:uncharacterized protein (DUF608 family)